MKLISCLCNCMPPPWYIFLVLFAGFANAQKCQNMMDIVIAVDTTSSSTAASFENVKTEVKGMVSGFTIGQSDTRLALISVSSQAQVMINFDGVKSQTDFNAAVDRLTFSAEIARLSMGVKTAKDSVLNTARGEPVLKILILVKDRRPSYVLVKDSAELALIGSESRGVKSMKALIHAVGVGGLWIQHELEAVFGTEYLLFKNKNKALESVASMNNKICEANCPNKGKMSTKEGLCNKAARHVISSRTDLELIKSKGMKVCRTEITRSFLPCGDNEKCDIRNKEVSQCGADSKVTIMTTWQSFDRKIQSCVTSKSTQTIDCADALKCHDQVADVIFILDKSGSIKGDFPWIKQATRVLIESLNVGPKNVMVGIMRFGTGVEQIVQLGSIADSEALLKESDGMNPVMNPKDQTFTDLGIKQAREDFAKYGRKDVPKFVFLLTDGHSNRPGSTVEETKLIKSDGVTVYAIGVGNIKVQELQKITAPETDTHMVILKNFKDLKTWSEGFSKKLCAQLTAPNPRLCDDEVFIQSISDCEKGTQQLTRTDFKYNSEKKCIKAIQMTQFQNCRSKCIDPTDGNEYFDGDSWTSLCHEFKCTSNSPKAMVPVSSKCLAADGSCKDVGSPPFRCFNDQNIGVDNCQCLSVNGKVTLVIDT